MAKEYRIPCEDNTGDFVMVVEDSHPVWELLHEMFNAAVEFRSITNEYERWCKVGDFRRRLHRLEFEASCMLLGYGFVTADGECIA